MGALLNVGAILFGQMVMSQAEKRLTGLIPPRQRRRRLVGATSDHATANRHKSARIENGQSGELKARIKADANSKSFQGRIKAASESEFGPTISFKNSRSILFKGLTAGMTYVFELCAIGGSTGLSDWSEPATKMAQ